MLDIKTPTEIEPTTQPALDPAPVPVPDSPNQSGRSWFSISAWSIRNPLGPARSARREPFAVTKALPRVLGLRRKRQHSPSYRSSFSHFRPGAWTNVKPVRPVELAQLVCIRALAISC
jgi:hypothetical protein